MQKLAHSTSAMSCPNEKNFFVKFFMQKAKEISAETHGRLKDSKMHEIISLVAERVSNDSYAKGFTVEISNDLCLMERMLYFVENSTIEKCVVAFNTCFDDAYCPNPTVYEPIRVYILNIKQEEILNRSTEEMMRLLYDYLYASAEGIVPLQLTSAMLSVNSKPIYLGSDSLIRV